MDPGTGWAWVQDELGDSVVGGQHGWGTAWSGDSVGPGAAWVRNSMGPGTGWLETAHGSEFGLDRIPA
ncbi:Hypothetical protein DEACI_3829 [Acididesulfobacillus acetoxydans]|uniref:Uncharacterized protein n=1 Tax=Acididesulfobacillus acetoxydans TaxID=1561005 RepID=A0A8S0XD10_9FIRM|nr:hypothetical protein [Acididesulfobacillus acetoxydans]CAA7603006.1 Hypothetical protein DEACI_3829 [Acididesulfobacillus acetoxydans]CEJ05888.1 Hypothetical protein DEACI_0308 [Acididesulfobacillus acetoxydans]